LWKLEKMNVSNSRGKLYDCVAVLWAQHVNRSFVTFTLPSLENGIYQKSVTCCDTGDLAIGKAFSRTLEAWKVKEKRRGFPLSYVWVCEAQMKRQAKFGGVGDLHYHLIVNRKLKHDNGHWCDRKTFQWLQDNWNKQLGTNAQNAVHVDPLPGYMKSIPAYLGKYLGKGVQRPIISRKFQATQDLTQFAPIKLNQLPDDLTLIRETTYTTPTGFDVQQRYYNTSETLETYGHHFLDQSRWNGARYNEDKLAGQKVDEFLRYGSAQGLIIVDTTPTDSKVKSNTPAQKRAQKNAIYRQQQRLF
jgi:hypothetical protein